LNHKQVSDLLTEDHDHDHHAAVVDIFSCPQTRHSGDTSLEMGTMTGQGDREMRRHHISASQEMLGEFCERHHIRRLALFGSVLRDDFTPQSDIDVLAEFAPGEAVGYIRLGTVEAELSDLVGRQVDLNLKDSLNPTFREQVLSEAKILYDAA
jgi:predicted nucleotidyltransferase